MFSLKIHPLWIKGLANMDYEFVQNGMQMNFFDYLTLISRRMKISGTNGTRGASMSLLG